MCRMLIALGKIDPTILLQNATLMAQDLLSEHEHNQGQKGTFTHPHGHGICYKDNHQFYIIKKPTSIFKEQTHHSHSSNQTDLKIPPTDFLIIHVRKATVGNISCENTHPFHLKTTKEEYVFCHNGTLKNNIQTSNKHQLQGTTDSERLFHNIVEKFETTNNPHSIAETIQLQDFPAACNIILSTKHATYISINCNKHPKYSHMHLYQDQHQIVISSESLPSYQPSTELPHGTLLKINNNTKEIEHLTKLTPIPHSTTPQP